MPKQEDVHRLDNCYATGWGQDKFESIKYQSILKHRKLNMVQHNQCEAMMKNTNLGETFQLDKSFICAGGKHFLSD